MKLNCILADLLVRSTPILWPASTSVARFVDYDAQAWRTSKLISTYSIRTQKMTPYSIKSLSTGTFLAIISDHTPVVLVCHIIQPTRKSLSFVKRHSTISLRIRTLRELLVKSFPAPKRDFIWVPNDVRLSFVIISPPGLLLLPHKLWSHAMSVCLEGSHSRRVKNE